MVFKSNVILAIGAHPDDIELGCGGTIRAATSAGKKVIAVYLTRGEMSGDIDLRPKESIAALAVLGVKEVHFGDFPDTEIPSSHEVIDFLEKFYNESKADTVLTHTTNDMHQDHRQVGWLSMSAFRSVPRMLAFETPRVTPAFAPNYFVDISGYVKDKWTALKFHVSQGSKRYLAYESMINLASFRGSQVGLSAAEAFEVVRYVETAP